MILSDPRNTGPGKGLVPIQKRNTWFRLLLTDHAKWIFSGKANTDRGILLAIRQSSIDSNIILLLYLNNLITP